MAVNWTDLVKDVNIVTGKMAVLLLVIGTAFSIGFWSIHEITETANANEVNVARLQEQNAGLRDKVDDILQTTHRIEDRLRNIELENAAGSKINFQVEDSKFIPTNKKG